VIGQQNTNMMVDVFLNFLIRIFPENSSWMSMIEVQVI